MHRDQRAAQIAALHPHDDAREVYRILVTLEFPWDMNQALSLALFRTYAVPSVGRLLFETGEFTERTQKRYDDTALLLDAMLTDGLDGTDGRAALRRMNQMHAMYDISNDDMRYVLATFVVVPLRWVDAYGWRRFTEHERQATVHYYRDLARHMGIRDAPDTWQGFCELLDAYEVAHFAYDAGARAVADATLDLATTFSPLHLLPQDVARRSTLALMDDPLLDAFAYPRPSPLLRRATRAGVRLRGRVLRHFPVRTTPVTSADLPNIRSYADGFDVRELGTFRPAASGCPRAG
ncbi:oxygenase MpaB family protein [Nocardioides massiliensis]|uniref:DUF2236 domain-containing protein n=1 Tax=Nocardioides massiliensis TaxID=1325935 RepID=A0ABT9NL81_9ACTN|nr:oxygenase MpaB family protein [Nocardioides massiliensis]MDP9821101.1 hypothetical protein [Nocardioides massiliensis]